MIYLNGPDSLVIKSWCNEPEAGAINQAINLARLPFAFKQICLMPDTHQGYGMPIGGVMATKNVIVPNAVGVDIGCGMAAVQTSIHAPIYTDLLKTVLVKIQERIPVGFNHHQQPCAESTMPWTSRLGIICKQEYESARKQLGTLGGGNHFIEIQCDTEGYIWIMIHSGSRNLGKKVAEYYNKKAVELNEKYFSSVPKEHQLAFLPVDSPEGREYIKEMNYCVEFAKHNRWQMMYVLQSIFEEVFPDITFTNHIEVAHNYARLENHFRKNVWVHRKGATSAKKGELGIIPGSQGTTSYIVRGLGNEESFMSCSHGAGRKMGRKEAERTLNLEDEQNKLDSQGILHSIRGTQDLDEAAGAYKDIDVVMEEQKDLVEIVHKLRPLAVVKG